MRELSSYWWEFKNRDIKAYVNSCDTCAKPKWNYGKRSRWPIGHCKPGKRPFELVFIDFVTIPNPKGKRYIFTILDNFSRHFTVIPCARDRAIDVVRGLCQFFLCHREIAHIVSSDRGTHFTDNFAAKCPLYRNFTVPGDRRALEILSGNIAQWRMSSIRYSKTETVNGQTSSNLLPHP